MQLVNILLTIGLVVLISGITVLALCAVIASSKSDDNVLAEPGSTNSNERRKNASCNFPVKCDDGTTVYFDRRLHT